MLSAHRLPPGADAAAVDSHNNRNGLESHESVKLGEMVAHLLPSPPEGRKNLPPLRSYPHFRA